MATMITLYAAQDGTQFTTEAEANAHDVLATRLAEIQEFCNKHFPSKEDAKKKNPHAGTAVKAISLWIAEKQQ